MNRWEKLLIVAGAVICALVIGAVGYYAGNTITVEQAIGLPSEKITMVVVNYSGGTPLETTDQAKISALMAQLNPQKLRVYPESIKGVMAGWSYGIDVYSSPGNFKRFDLSGSIQFISYGNFAGPNQPGYWTPEDADAVYQIMRNFYIELGGQPVE